MIVRVATMRKASADLCDNIPISISNYYSELFLWRKQARARKNRTRVSLVGEER